MRVSLPFKLIAAFAAIIVIGLAVVYIQANRATATELRHFMFRGGMVEADEIAAELANYYAQTGSWEGVGLLIQARSGLAGRGRGVGWMMAARLMVADGEDRIVADSQGRLTGQQLSHNDLAEGVPIIFSGRRVGTLLVEGGSRDAFSPLEREFLASVNRAILIAGLLAGGIALVLGGLLIRQITAPLGALRTAAERIAQGDLAQRVEVRSNDEIGDLAYSFNAMAESLDRAEMTRRNMVADVAHELRTPLSVIQGNLEALLDGVHPLIRENIASIHEETLLLSHLVEDLRELALAEARQLKLDCQTVDLAELIGRTVQAMQPQANEKQIVLTAEMTPNLPFATVDPRRVEQVLRNLLTNALRHTPPGGQVKVECTMVESTNSQLFTSQTVGLLVRVRDTGRGIASVDLPFVFDRFWRADRSRSRADGGAGLGLAIARQLVEAHGGQISVESGREHGATFSFTLPMSHE